MYTSNIYTDYLLALLSKSETMSIHYFVVIMVQLLETVAPLSLRNSVCTLFQIIFTISNLKCSFADSGYLRIWYENFNIRFNL